MTISTTVSSTISSPATSPATALQLEGICRRIGARTILEDLDLTVSPGECLALLGPSGCGKSSTLRLISGLDSPDRGRILLGQRDITALPPARRQVAMVLQSYALYPHLSVARNLSLGMEIRGVDGATIARDLNAVLELLQLGELRQRRPADLSGGQRQRVALARALLRRPQLFLLDEPMSNLDAQLREELRPQLRAILCGGGAPVVYVTHDQQEAMGIADRIAVLDAGRLQQCGTSRELYHRPATLFVAQFIGRPQINVLQEPDGSLLAVRPEHLQAVEEGGVQVRVVSREWQGASQQLQLDTPRGPLRWVCDGGRTIGDTVRIAWEPRHEHRFAAGGGRRLTP